MATPRRSAAAPRRKRTTKKPSLVVDFLEGADRSLPPPFHKRPVPTLTALLGLAIGALLVGNALLSSARAPVDIGEETLSASTQPYASLADGYQVRYPSHWKIEQDGQTRILSGADNRVLIAVTRAAPDGGLFTDATLPFILRGLPATRYRDFDLTTLAPIDRVVIELAADRFVEIRGSGPSFESIVQSFRPLGPVKK